ncbi:hypothetical protein AB0F52_38685 [Amycolatopsis sp. NPDC024027]|uniref:hypothetical protein n=1 Tax=Amycolatopsis sp. NPDC024027 TaxID=3154327 RepID=UPI0033F1E1EC
MSNISQHAHAGRFEAAFRQVRTGVGGDLACDSLRLQQREERLLHWEVAGIARGVDVGMAEHLTCARLTGEETTVVGGQPLEPLCRDVRRERDQEIELLRAAVGVGDLELADLVGSGAGAAFDATLRELRGDDVMQLGAERLDVTLLGRRERELDVVADLTSPQPAVEHQGDLVQGADALVPRRNEEQDSLQLAVRGVLDHPLQLFAQRVQPAGGPDRVGVLGEAGHLLRAHGSAGDDHELVLGHRPARRVHDPTAGVDAFGGRDVGADFPSAQRFGQLNVQWRLRRAEGQVRAARTRFPDRRTRCRARRRGGGT